MIARAAILILCIALVSSCATTGRLGLSGKLTHEQLSTQSYYIRFDTGSLSLPFQPESAYMPSWLAKARELCGGDFYHDAKGTFFGASGFTIATGAPHIKGVAYCISNFVDTREMTADENFRMYESVPFEVFQYQELNPVWDLLMSEKFNELDEQLLELHEAFIVGEFSEQQYIGLLETFSRITPVAEEKLTKWIQSNPNMFLAYFARAKYYFALSWHHRGNTYWKYVTEEQKKEFFKYSELARQDIEQAIKIKPNFPLAYSTLISIVKSNRNMDDSLEKLFEQARISSPYSMVIHEIYLNTLLPRWGGSEQKMQDFIDNAASEDGKFSSLNALFYAEQGDQLFFKKKYKAALLKYNEAVKFGDFSYIYHQRAVCLNKLQRYVDAIEDFENALSISPYYTSTYENLVRTLLNQNNYIGALKASMYLTAMNNQKPEYFVAQGNIFYAMRRYEDALVSYQKASVLSDGAAFHRYKIKTTEFQIDVRRNEEQKAENFESV